MRYTLIIHRQLMNDYFLFTERVFPVLHRPTFLQVVDDLYNRDIIGIKKFEHLAQFYFTISIAYWFDQTMSLEEKTHHQIRALQTACRCYLATLHMRRDGLTRLQTMILHSYALLLLRQRAEAVRMSAVANTKALEVGLHHDGKHFNGNPLETQMRRRIFWCVFMLRKYLFRTSPAFGISLLPKLLPDIGVRTASWMQSADGRATSYAVLPLRHYFHRIQSIVLGKDKRRRLLPAVLLYLHRL